MRGDLLAGGAAAAAFPAGGRALTDAEFDAKVGTVPPVKTLFAECKDCGKPFYSAREFSDHVHSGQC
jgi:hypothetical protein